MLCPSQSNLQRRTTSIAELNSLVGIAKDRNMDLQISLLILNNLGSPNLLKHYVITYCENGCITPILQYCPIMVLLFE